MMLRQVHLKNKKDFKNTKNSIDGRAYPLNEIKVSKTIFEIRERVERVKLIYRVINYLDVEHSRRYLVDGSRSFCNIYASDVMYVLGAYLPRVWWKSELINNGLIDSALEPQYGVTVEELNTLGLYNWLKDYGTNFNWKKAKNFRDFKQEINKGTVGVICAISKNKTGNHICVALPKISLANKLFSCFYNSILLSEAGLKNSETFFNKWWRKDKFESKFYFLVLLED